MNSRPEPRQARKSRALRVLPLPLHDFPFSLFEFRLLNSHFSIFRFTYLLLFHTFANSFAACKSSTLLFSNDCELIAQNTRGWGRGQAFPPISIFTFSCSDSIMLTSHLLRHRSFPSPTPDDRSLISILFRINTSTTSRKCCIQRTYGFSNFFGCNTYTKHRGRGYLHG